MKLNSANEIKIYFVTFTSMSFTMLLLGCQLLRDGLLKQGDEIILNFMDCSYKPNSDDCGLHLQFSLCKIRDSVVTEQ